MPVTPLACPGAAPSASVAASFRAVSLLQIAIIVSKVKGSLLGWFICFLVAGNRVDGRGGGKDCTIGGGRIGREGLAGLCALSGPEFVSGAKFRACIRDRDDCNAYCYMF
jgi:hypothetical protein